MEELKDMFKQLMREMRRNTDEIRTEMKEIRKGMSKKEEK